METNQAAEHLQVIRTLMERSAVYRRALAPVMFFVGTVGVLAAAIGLVTKATEGNPFQTIWLTASGVASVGAFVLIRRQALRAAEPFWTPPTRRIVLAIAPPFAAAASVSMIFLWQGSGRGADTMVLPPVWMAFYGCALHAAGFFMPRGIRWLGWMFVAAGCGLLTAGFGLGISIFGSEPAAGHLAMGTVFGGLHLAYGIYLYFTEKRRNES